MDSHIQNVELEKSGLDRIQIIDSNPWIVIESTLEILTNSPAPVEFLN